MRDVPAQMTRAWRSGNYTGDQMPRVRCVVGRPHMTLHRYTFPKAALPLTTTSGVRNIVAQTPGSGGLAGIGISQRIRDGVLPSSGTTTNTFASFLFNDDIPQEIANVKSVSWDRGIDQDVGSCTIELYNIHPRHAGEQFQGGDPWRTGWFSWNYGKVPTLTQRYGQLTSEAWYWAFVPDNWIKTFEGYGADYSLTPEDDPHMVQTGIWKIKDVTLSAAGLTVKITAEDYGSLLTEQIVAEPVVPKDWLPLTFGPIPGPVTATSDLVNEGSPIKLSITKTSNLPWNGDGPMYGHSPHHGMDGNHSCVDDQTEIFTQRGWLKHDEIREGDMTLGIDHQTWKARWDRIGEVQRYDHDGDLIRIKSRRHDSLTTPNHNWPTRRRQRGKATSGGYLHEMRRTDELACEDAIPLAADVTNLPTVETYSNAFVEVVAWFCTDGSAGITPEGNPRGSICQSPTANAQNCAQIADALSALGPEGRGHQWKVLDKVDEALKRLAGGEGVTSIARSLGTDTKMIHAWSRGEGDGLRWSTYLGGSGLRYWHFSPRLMREVQKVAPGGLVEYDFLNQLTKDQLDLYLDVCIKADGSRTGNQVKFAAEHESEIRRFEHAALLAGHGVSTTKETRTGGAFIKPGRSSEIWICYLLQQGPIHPKSRRETERFSNEHYKGVIWCPTTATGTWLMRRNGKVSFTGNSYWLSVGNESPSRGFAYEYMEFSTGGKVHLGQVKFSTVKAGYVAYLSISIDGGHTWLTKGQVIGWNSESIGRNGGNIPYSQTMSVPNENTQTFLVNEHNVTHFRITLGNLQDFGLGSYRYRGAFREVSATTARSVSQDSVTYRTHPDDATAAQYPGVMSDITDIVKLCLAWAGFFWPENARTALCNTRQDPQRRRWRNTAWKQGDPFFGKRGWAGRVWADLEQTGTTMPAGLKDLSHSTLMETISRCREVCGFVFWVDETGAPIWRLPNLYSRGNWVGTLSQQPRRTQDIVTVDERVQLVDIDVRLSGRNTREEVQVGSPDGKVGAKVKGWLANPVGLRRSAIYADQNFKSDREAQVMADMIALRQMYSYREDTLTIPGYPGIQIDDQIRVIERSTVEAFLHYVKSVSMTWDQESGEYFYTLQTHWLGSDPKGTWVLRPEELTPPTRALIDRRVEDMRRSWESPTMGTIRRPQPPLIIWEKLK